MRSASDETSDGKNCTHGPVYAGFSSIVYSAAGSGTLCKTIRTPLFMRVAHTCHNSTATLEREG
jgi:hypothetical protein